MKRISVGAFGLVMLMAIGASAGTAWLHVQVEDGGESSVNINLPLSVAQIAMHAVADEVADEIRLEARDIRVGDGEITIADLKRMWREMRHVADGELLSMVDGDSSVRVFHRGDRLHVQVDSDDGERVRIEIPADVVDVLLAPQGEEIDLGGALARLDAGFRGDLVQVEDGDDRVRIWVD